MPFLMPSDSASRKRPFSTGLFFDWILLVLLLIVSRVDFIVFALFLEAVGVREYCCTAAEIGWQLCASRFLREQRLDEPSSQRVGGFGLSRKPPKLQQPQPLLAAWDRDRALLPSCDTRCWRAKLGMRHADLLREATAGIAKPAPAPCMILQCGTWYGYVAVWPCGCVLGGEISDAIGSINTCKTFSTEFFDWRIQSKKSSFSTGSASRNSQSKKIESKKPFFDCVRKPIWASVEKGRFRLTNPTA